MEKLIKKIDPSLLFTIALVSAGLFYTSGNYWWKTWTVKWMSLLVLLLLWIAWKVKEKTHWSLALAFFWTIVTGMAVFASRGGLYANELILDRITFQSGSLYSTFCFLMLSIFYLLYIEKIEIIEKALAHFCWVDLLVTLYGYLANHLEVDRMGGAFGNPSMNLCFLVMCYPVFIHHFKKIWQVTLVGLPIMVLVGISHKSMPIGVLAAVLTGAWISRRGIGDWVFLIPGSVLLLAYLISGERLFVDEGRYKLWDIMMTYWWWNPQSRWHILFGTAPGTAQILAPAVQMAHGYKNSWFLWFHNDWLQCLFEQGLIGLAIYLKVFWETMKRAWDKPYLLASVFGFAIAALGNYPCRLALQAFFGLFLVIRSMTAEDHFSYP